MGKKNRFRAPLFSLYAARDRVPFFEKSGPPANFFRFFFEISTAVPENIPRFGGTLSEKGTSFVFHKFA